MFSAPRILWGEGLFLRPQHFQLQDAYHEARRVESTRMLHPYAWGVRSLKFDAEAIKSGLLLPVDLNVIFPDGEAFAAPGSDNLPEALNLAAMPELPDTFLVYLAIAPIKLDSTNLTAEGEATGKQTRFVSQEIQANDWFTNAVPSEVMVLKRQARLLTETQSREGLITLPVARVRKSQTAGFELDGAFIPPVTSINGATSLTILLKRLLDILQAKVNALYGHHRESGKNIIEFRSGDIASFWLLHTSSSAYAGLLHLYQHPQLHPERLFQQLLQLAGSLMTFSKSYTLADLPAYSHADATRCFLQLDRIIRELLETVISARFLSIPLSETKPSYWLGRLDSDKIDADTRFYMAVSAAVPAAEIVDSVPMRFKIGSPDDVEKLVLSAMPGVPIAHAPQVPSAVPVRAGSFYFEVEPRGMIYERMMQSQSMVIYVPNGFPELKIELIAVTQ